MTVEAANAVLFCVLVYAGVGLLFSILFVTRALPVVDPAAKGAPWPFRVLIVPATAAMWPFMAAKWARARSGRTP